MANPSGLISRKYYDSYNSLQGARPGEMADPETFYTPELQESILSELTRQAQEGNAVNQSAISGQAVLGGFGVGNTSREATRRARADAQALDEVVQGYVNQATQIEQMRVSQQQEQASRNSQADQDKLNQEQDFRLSQQGYRTSEDSQKRGYDDASKYATQDMLFGGLTGIAGGAGSLFAQQRSKPKPYSPAPEYESTYLPNSLSLFSQNQFNPTSIFGR